MKHRSRNRRKAEKREPKVISNVARAVGSALGSIAATSERLREKSRAIGSQAGTLARKTRKRISSATARPNRATKRKSR
jgi:hypothetical protein